ncbi:MAG: UbiA family prenyltransferase [Thermoanaerobaculia bacterium]
MGSVEATSPAVEQGKRATVADYVALARPDHWVKHVFILPGVVLALVLHDKSFGDVLIPVLVGFASAAAIASANYVLNEWLDAHSDAHHPIKSERPAVRKKLNPLVVFAEYVGLVVVGLLLAVAVSKLFFWTSCLFLVSGLVYNVPPIRTKEKVYLDVLSEAVNNPIRLTLGWAMVDSTTLPPSSLLLAYWMGGAYLMTLKRFAEYRSAIATGTLEALERYRRSFRYYNESSLLLAAFLYALMAAFFLAVFLIKYRVEYLLSLPLFAALFVSYLRIALKQESSAQAPERLFHEKTLVGISILLVIVLALLTWIDIPLLERLSDPHYIVLPGG